MVAVLVETRVSQAALGRVGPGGRERTPRRFQGAHERSSQLAPSQRHG